MSMAAFLLCACGASDTEPSGSPERTAGEEQGRAFDLKDAGMRGMIWTGSARLLSPDMEFDLERLEMGTITFSLITEPADLSEFNNPPLEFRGESVNMAVHISGRVNEHRPGRIETEIESVRPIFSGGLGSNDEENMVKALASNGVVLPRASSAEPISVTFNVLAHDEENLRISLTSDVDWIGRVDARGGDKAGY